MDKKIKIELCPFCSKEHLGENLQIKKRGYMYSVVCACGAMGPTGCTKKEAVELWNLQAAGKLRECLADLLQIIHEHGNRQIMAHATQLMKAKMLIACRFKKIDFE